MSVRTLRTPALLTAAISGLFSAHALDRIPFGDRLKQYEQQIAAKLAEIASTKSSTAVSALSAVTRGTMSFFSQLFIMLYSMFFFLISGPEVLGQIRRLVPLADDDQDLLLDEFVSVSRATLRRWTHQAIATCALSVLLCTSAAAQQTENGDAPNEADALAKAAQNPLASLVTLPIQANWNDGVGEYDRTFFNLNIQPVVPFQGKKWNVISRTIIPVNSVPVGELESSFGIGDTSFSLFWSPAKASSLTWGIGPAFSIPTSSNPELLGSGKWSTGPTGVLFYGVGKWTLGAVASNIWSFAGENGREDVNFFFAQWFINYNFGGGLALGTAPIITCDWTYEPSGDDDDDQCTVPIGLQISKVMQIGSQPINVLLGYYENLMHPVNGATSQVRLQINFMFPQK